MLYCSIITSYYYYYDEQWPYIDLGPFGQWASLLVSVQRHGSSIISVRCFRLSSNNLLLLGSDDTVVCVPYTFII